MTICFIHLKFFVNKIINLDCRGYTHFFNGVGNYHNGYPKVLKNAVCIYEDDGGVLWRKTVPGTGRTMTVRANRLAIMTIVTSGNYDYMVNSGV